MSKKKSNETADDMVNTKRQLPSTNQRLPLFLDFTLSISQIVVVVMGGLTTGLSLYAGASLIVAVARGCVAILSIGIIGWLINWLFSHNGIQATRHALMNGHQSAMKEDTSSTVEIKA